MDRGAWRAKVTKVHKESDKTELLSTHALRLRIGWYVQERQAFLIQLLSLKRLPREACVSEAINVRESRIEKTR